MHLTKTTKKSKRQIAMFLMLKNITITWDHNMFSQKTKKKKIQWTKKITTMNVYMTQCHTGFYSFH